MTGARAPWQNNERHIFSLTVHANRLDNHFMCFRDTDKSVHICESMLSFVSNLHTGRAWCKMIYLPSLNQKFLIIEPLIYMFDEVVKCVILFWENYGGILYKFVLFHITVSLFLLHPLQVHKLLMLNLHNTIVQFMKHEVYVMLLLYLQ